MSLVVFTAVCGLFLAPGSIDIEIAVIAIFCIAAGAGAAGAINMWYDEDIDRLMGRTKNRPIPAGRMKSQEALVFGTCLALGSVLTMYSFVNFTSAALLALTILYYVFIYTIWLKRRTAQNIVIGGAAGALPPIIGWAAVTGDIGVGGREIGYMFGQYKRIRNEFTGVLTGKGLNWGGSLIRPEATGYGCVYFAEEMLKTKDDSLKGKTVTISGSGNVAQYATEKVNDLGGKVVTLSDSSGTVYDKNGIDSEKLAFIMELKNVKRGRIKEYADKYNTEYLEGEKPWRIACDVALPCATQNELNIDEAKELTKNGCIAVDEGANMPTEPDAVNLFLQFHLCFHRMRMKLRFPH